MIVNITPYPATMELKAVVLTGEFLEESTTLWMEFRNGNLNLMDHGDPVPEGMDLNMVRTLIMVRLANGYLAHLQDEKDLAKKIEEMFTAPIELPSAT